MVLFRWPELRAMSALPAELPPGEAWLGGAVLLSIGLLVLLSVVLRGVLETWLE
jgi:hypothetical protein